MKRCLIFIFLFTSFLLHAQVNPDEQDTTKSIFNKIQESKASKALVHSITRNPGPNQPFNAKSEDAFIPFTGKIIRHIIINHIGFDKTMTDTTRSIKNTVTKVGNALHSNTEKWVIRDNLFIKEGSPLNPYKLADNERYLRDLDFILDARIKVKRVKKDSVDIIITTRDVFSLSGSLNVYSPTNYKFKIRDSNLSGWGQRVELNGIIDNKRNPSFGPEFVYTKSSLGGSLANLSVGVTTLNSASSYGNENEYAAYLRLDRPLVSPYSRLAGGFELSKNWSRNVLLTNDSLFRKYDYIVTDLWMGYNIGVNNMLKNRSRHFVSLRTFNQKFVDPPTQLSEKLNPIYNDKKYILGQITFFNQNFYKTQYVYGFGRTEDVPYGQNVSLLAGLVSQLNLNRIYIGGSIERTLANRSGDFYQYTFRTEGFDYKNKLQDISILMSSSVNSRLYVYPRVKIRQYFRVSYTALFKRTINPLLSINNDFGVVGLKSDSLKGIQRFGLHTETVMYTNWKLFGFNFAPLIFADVAFLSKEKQSIFYDQPYYGLGAGLRTRNENLVFGTIEARVTFFPRVEDGSHFRMGFRTNLRFKSTGTLVKAPAFILYN